MSLFDLEDVCIVIGSIATLDLPMVVDLIGIYGLKGPYCTLTTTNWFLQALSVIPRGSWGNVARRSYHDPLGRNRRLLSYLKPPPPPCAAARLRRKIISGQFDEENPFVLISSVLLVQADKGVSFLVVDRIGDIYRNLSRRADIIVTTVGARHKYQQVGRHFSHDVAPVGHTLAGSSGDADCANVERWCAPCRALVSEEAGRWLAIAAMSRRSWHLLADVMMLAAVHVGRWLRAGRAMRARCGDGACPLRRVQFSSWRRRRRPAAAPARLRRCRDSWSDFFYGLVRACPGQPVKFSGRIDTKSESKFRPRHRRLRRRPFQPAVRTCARDNHACWPHMVAGSGAARRASVAHEAAENCRSSSRARCSLAAQLRCAGRTIGARWTATGLEGCALAADAGRPLPLLGGAAWSSAVGRRRAPLARRCACAAVIFSFVVAPPSAGHRSGESPAMS
ncbi:hypothetical protein F511_39520 [Dorcoceras hygrometricum]|uniref:Uncharacterized protein n=1 Tax=Dorcoceras hygrometricum TaxID=472368 RepID=A0A2Z7CAU8_9LAMI|nr:hypothetical protein F511_39520 [Dorcoceras hygrometricum]